MTKITYEIVPNAGLPAECVPDDYVGINIYLDGEYQTCFTGFLSEDLVRRLLKGEGDEI